MRAEGGAGGCAYSSIIHPDGAVFPYSGPYPRGIRCGAVGAAAAEGTVRLGRILVETILLVGRGMPPISSTWALLVGVSTHEIWAFAGEIKFEIHTA